MANEAYRAVFLRVHPTGKMVLSLTTESDGHEPEYARQVADELGVPPLDVKVVPADLDRFGTGHGFNTSPSPGTAAGDRRATGKILAKAPPARRRRARRSGRCAAVVATARSSAGERAGRERTIADIAMYAHGTGALPPGVEGGLDAQTVYRD